MQLTYNQLLDGIMSLPFADSQRLLDEARRSCIDAEVRKIRTSFRESGLTEEDIIEEVMAYRRERRNARDRMSA